MVFVDSELRLRVKKIEDKTQKTKVALEKEALLKLRYLKNYYKKCNIKGITEFTHSKSDENQGILQKAAKASKRKEY